MERVGVREIGAAALVAAFLLTRGAAAAEPTADDLARAKALFAEAEAAEARGDLAAACPLLEQVLAVKETPGVLFHRANCLEATDRLVEALATFERAERLAGALGVKDVLDLVGPRLRALDDRVPSVLVHVEPAAAGATLTVDGVARPLNEGRARLRLETGHHRFVVTAPGRPPLEARRLLLERAVDEVRFTVGPPLAGPRREPRPATTSTAETPDADGVPVLPLALGVGAAGALAAGVALFVAAGDRNDAGRAACGAGACDPDDVLAVRNLDRGAIGAWAGGGLLAVGAVVSAAFEVGPRIGSATRRGAVRWAVTPDRMVVQGDF